MLQIQTLENLFGAEFFDTLQNKANLLVYGVSQSIIMNPVVHLALHGSRARVLFDVASPPLLVHEPPLILLFGFCGETLLSEELNSIIVCKGHEVLHADGLGVTF